MFGEKLGMARFRQLFILTLIACSVTIAKAQEKVDQQYEPSQATPYGTISPEAPPSLGDFDELIGLHDCTSVLRNPDQSWADEQPMIWKWKYIMNGLAVQDEVYSTNGRYAGSIRQFDADSAKWYVHYYSSQGFTSTLSSWVGEKRSEEGIVLYKEQKAPNGMEGFYKIVFSEIEEASFRWTGSWVNADESIVFPTWKIACKKRE